MKKVALTLIVVLALLVSLMAITATAEVDITSAAYRNTVSQKAKEELAPALAGNPATVEALCPVCNEKVIWRAVSITQGSTSGYHFTGEHRYLTADLNATSYFRVTSGKGCFYLNGHSITSSSIAFEIPANTTVNIIGNGTETISGKNYSSPNSRIGATFDMTGGTLNLFGGIFTKDNSVVGPVLANRSSAGVINIYEGTTITGGVNTDLGGNIALHVGGAKLNIYGGTISNGKGTRGGNIVVNGDGNCEVNISGGTIIGGQATASDGRGGNIICYYGDINISGGRIENGSAYIGGNITVIRSGSELKISGGTITGGTAQHGGNIRTEESAVLTMTGGNVSNGSVTVQGGNVNMGSSTSATISGGTISGGSAADRGGSIYANANCTINVSGSATITGGNSTGFSGGNMALEKSTLTMTGGTISNGTAHDGGGNIYLFSGAKATISGGTVSGGTATSGHGGNIHSNACGITLSGTGEITGGTAAAGNGGTLYMYNASFNVTGGTLTGGKAENGNGGAIMLEAANLFQSGGSITGGTAKNGGVIYAGGNSSSVVQISAGSLGGGNATVQGGNIFVKKGSLTVKGSAQVTGGTSKFQGGSVYATVGTTVMVEGGSISGGTNNDYGGNLALEGATLNMSGGSVTGGNGAYAGNIYLFYGSTATISGGSVTNGTAAVNGGNIYVKGSSALTMTGGSVTGGSAVSGGNIYVKDDAGMVTLTNVTVSGANATSTGGNVYTSAAVVATNCTFSGATAKYGVNFYHDAAVTLNNCTLSNGSNNTVMSDASLALNNTTITNTYVNFRKGTLTISGDTNLHGVLMAADVTKLHVESDYSGVVSIDGMARPTDPFYTGVMDETRYTSGGSFTGIVKIGDVQNQPQLHGVDGKLVVSAVKLANVNDDADVVWYLDAEAAINAYDALADKTGYYVHLMCNADVVVPAGKTAYINFNGETPANVTVGEGAKLYGFDGTFGAGKLSWSTFNTTQLEKAFVAPNGVFYVAIPYGEGQMKTAAVEVAVTGISLRTSTAGLYYSATVTCAEAAKQYLTYGIAVQLDAAPAENFKTTSLYTAETGVDGSTNGVLVNNILAEGDVSKERADRAIHAVAYVEYEGVNLLSNAKAYSLTDLMGLVNDSFDTLDAAKQALVKDFYDAYAAQVGWELSTIANFVVPTKTEEV